jgi:hypothetical protein
MRAGIATRGLQEGGTYVSGGGWLRETGKGATRGGQGVQGAVREFKETQRTVRGKAERGG